MLNQLIVMLGWVATILWITCITLIMETLRTSNTRLCLLLGHQACSSFNVFCFSFLFHRFFSNYVQSLVLPVDIAHIKCQVNMQRETACHSYETCHSKIVIKDSPGKAYHETWLNNVRCIKRPWIEVVRLQCASLESSEYPADTEKCFIPCKNCDW